MKQNVEIVAYVFADASGTLRALRFLDGIDVISRSEFMFDIRPTATKLPPNFFSDNVSHVAAIVGSNASGKSTVLQDINRVLAGQRPIAAKYSLIIRCDSGLYQLCSDPELVQFDGTLIAVGDPRHNTNLKVVFYAGGYDPFGRTKQLVPTAPGIQSCDISDQFIFNGEIDRDFDYKLVYLQSLMATDASSLFLEAEGERRRSIRFEARISDDADVTARDLIEFVLTFSNEFDRISDLLAALGLDSENDRANIFAAVQTKLIVNEPGAHFLPASGKYFESLYAYLTTHPRRKFFYSRLQFALALGPIVKQLHNKPNGLRKQLSIARMDFEALVTKALGPNFYGSLLALPAAAENVLSKDGARIQITLDDGPETKTLIQDTFEILLKLRLLGADFSFRFTGISEGQRTLLTFYSRLYGQAQEFRHEGNTLLLIDEHEHGLHPEWQRRYLNELLTFLKKPHFASERYQIVLSTHSPFLVSDLPETHVNRIDIDEPDDSPTLAANVLELLLSPLFLENSTSEFARRKIEGMLTAIGRAKSIKALNAASVLIPLLGDELIKNYCSIRVEEKKSTLLDGRSREYSRLKGRK